MKNAIYPIIVALLGLLFFVGCGKQSDISVEKILTSLQSDVETIVSIEMATEETDTNNLLGKQGSYIELGWFTDARIKQQYDLQIAEANRNAEESRREGYEFSNRWEYDSAEEMLKGITRGGGIEKFRNEKDAKKREELLDAVLGTPFSPGYHERIGVFVIRVSNKLTASQQKEYAEKIKQAMK